MTSLNDKRTTANLSWIQPKDLQQKIVSLARTICLMIKDLVYPMILHHPSMVSQWTTTAVSPFEQTDNTIFRTWPSSCTSQSSSHLLCLSIQNLYTLSPSNIQWLILTVFTCCP